MSPHAWPALSLQVHVPTHGKACSTPGKWAGPLCPLHGIQPAQPLFGVPHRKNYNWNSGGRDAYDTVDDPKTAKTTWDYVVESEQKQQEVAKGAAQASAKGNEGEEGRKGHGEDATVLPG